MMTIIRRYVLTPCAVSLRSILCMLEKGQRAKSGSAGEASSTSHSERSNSLGSLKGTGGTDLKPISHVSLLHVPEHDRASSKDYFPLLTLVSHLKRMSGAVFHLILPLICQMSPHTTCWTWRTAWKRSWRQMEICQKISWITGALRAIITLPGWVGCALCSL